MKTQNNTHVVYDDKTALKPSSNVSFISYEEDTSALTVTFKDGRMYQYYDVPREVVLGFYEDKSVGGYIYSTIRDQYKYEEL